MRQPKPYDTYDLSKIIIKPLYFGLGINIAIPVGLLLVCYFFNNAGAMHNKVGDFANTLFYLFWGAALIQAGYAVWQLRKSLREPMIRHQHTFEEDFVEELVNRSRPHFVLIAAISVWGYVYFLLTGRFNETVSFVVFSFIVFQVIRPRYGSVEKLLVHQQELVDEGKFLRD